MSKYKNISNTIQKITKVLQKGYTSDGNYDSREHPFFYQDKKEQFESNYNYMYNSKIPIGLNNNIKYIYHILNV